MNRTPSLLLPVATVFATFSALGAAPDLSGAASAAARSDVGAQQRKQIDDALGGPTVETADVSAGAGSISGAAKRFVFAPNGKAAEDAYDRLSEAQKDDLNRLGNDLVDFELDRPERISGRNQEIRTGLEKVREPAYREAKENYDTARDARIRAWNELKAVADERERAERRLKEAEGKVSDAEKKFDDVNAKIERANMESRDLGRAIAAQRERLEEANRDKTRAAAAAKAAAEEERDAKAAKTDAEAGLKAAEVALAGAQNVETAKAAAAAKAAAVLDAKDADVKAAKTARTAAKDALSNAEDALTVAKDALSDAREAAADGLAEKEEAEVRFGKAEARAAAAKSKLEETKKAAEQPRGWAARHLVPGWFLPSVSRDERRAAAAAEAVQSAEARLRAAQAALPGLDKAVAEATAAVAAKEEDRQAAVTALSGAGERLDAEKAERRTARDEAAAAEGARRAAESDRKRAAAAKRTAERADQAAGNRVEAAVAAVEEANARAVAATEKAVAEKTTVDELEKEKDPKAQAALVYRPDRERAEKVLLEARRERQNRAEALDRVTDRGADLNRKQSAYDEARRTEEQWKPQYDKAKRDRDNVRYDADRQVAAEEREQREKNVEKAAAFWDRLETEKTGAEAAQAGRGADKTGADVAGAEKNLTAAKGDLAKARAAADELAAAEKTARGKVKEAEKAASETQKAFDKAEKAFKAKGEAFEEANRKGEPGAVATARDELDAARKALAEARDARREPAQTLDAARKRAADAARALQEKKTEIAALEGKVKEADEARKKAERLNAANESAVRKSAARAHADVAALRKAFESQVDDIVNHRRAVLDEDGTPVDRMSAVQARAAYRAAKPARARALANYVQARSALDRLASAADRETRPWNESPALRDAFAVYEKARGEYAAVRTDYDRVENRYNAFFSDAAFRTDSRLSDADADARYETAAAKRALAGYRVKGDRRWLARTEVDGENLLDVLLFEMAWQAEALVDAGEAARDEYDPLSVRLSDEQAAACAAQAADRLKRRAVYGGFYFCGADASEADAEEKTVWVDKGRFGPSTVRFGHLDEGRAFATDEDDTHGRIYDATNILARLAPAPAAAPREAGTNDLAFAQAGDPLEGAAFNFADFRKRFNALNANPDIVRADVRFEPADDFDYGYDAEDPDMGAFRQTNRTVRTVVNVVEARRPAPIHGVLSVDNFNSMGEPDKIVGEADTWMARLLLQRRLGLFAADDALSIQGNVSLGGSLYGGAVSYYVPRDEDARFWRRGEGAAALAWTIHGGYTDVDQKDVISDLDVLGTGYYGGLQLSTRLADSGAGTWDLSAGLTYRYVENAVRIGGEEIKFGVGGDGYELLPLSVALLYADKDLDSLRGRNFATIEGVYNLGLSDEGELKAFRSTIDDANYILARIQFARLQLINEGASSAWLPRILFFKADGQWASTQVVGAEQYGLGGHSTVRGYAERQFMGDTGVSATLELRTPIQLNPAFFERRRDDPYKADERLQFVVFLDAGWFLLEDGARNADGTRTDDDKFLAGIGVGLRYSIDDVRVLSREISPVFRLDWGFPLSTSDIDTSSAGVIHTSLQFPF